MMITIIIITIIMMIINFNVYVLFVACITCRSCRGSDGSNCHLQPHLETGVTACGSDKTECAVFVQFQADKNSGENLVFVYCPPRDSSKASLNNSY